MKQCWGKDKGDGVQGVFAVGEPEKVAAVEKILEQYFTNAMEKKQTNKQKQNKTKNKCNGGGESFSLS